MTLSRKTVFITGGSRGIGLAIALRAARDGARVAIAAKTAQPHPKLPGTIYTAARQIEAAGGQALPLVCDIRFEDQVQRAVAETVAQFGGIDICVNNASAISLTKTAETEMKRYDLMHQVNTRGTFLVSKTCLPHLKQADNPHILNLSPPLEIVPAWFGENVAYTIAKMGMSMCTLGMAEELRGDGIAVNSLWPFTTIDTSAVRNVLAERVTSGNRTPEIIADSAHAILTRPAKECTANFFIDEEVLRAGGVEDFSKYATRQDVPFTLDYFVPDQIVRRSLTKTVNPV